MRRTQRVPFLTMNSSKLDLLSKSLRKRRSTGGTVFSYVGSMAEHSRVPATSAMTGPWKGSLSRLCYVPSSFHQPIMTFSVVTRSLGPPASTNMCLLCQSSSVWSCPRTWSSSSWKTGLRLNCLQISKSTKSNDLASISTQNRRLISGPISTTYRLSASQKTFLP